MPAVLTDLPFWPLVAALCGVVFCRAQGTYWLARFTATGADRTRWGRLLRSAPVRRGALLLDRWGLPLVALSFLVIGLQTIMNAAAGAARIPWWRYLLAMLPGCVAWAFITATVGFAVLWAVIAALAGSGWGALVLAVIVLAAAAVIRVRGGGAAPARSSYSHDRGSGLPDRNYSGEGRSADGTEARMEPVTPTRDPLALESQVCFALSVASRTVVDAYRVLLEPLHLTHPQYLVMLALWEHAPLTVKRLSALLRLNPGTVSPLVKRLATLGYVARARDESDERALSITLTARGSELRRQAERIPVIMMRRLGLNEDDLVALHGLMTRLIASADGAAPLEADEILDAP